MMADEAIEQLSELIAEIDTLRNGVQSQAAWVESQWKGLKACGGARADHAATLLVALNPKLSALREHVDHCMNQITAMAQNPWESVGAA